MILAQAAGLRGVRYFRRDKVKKRFLLAGLLFPAVVQAASLDVRGEVKDTLGRPVPAAKLTLQTAEGKVIAQGESSRDGHFVFSLVPPGIYAVLAVTAGFKPGTSIVTVSAGKPATVSITLAASRALELSVVAAKLEQARNGLSPKTGGSLYRFTANDIKNLPQGENTSFNDVLLQAPGVVNDTFGVVHIRGDHGNTQTRINGVILPDGVSGFGQAIDTRFAQRIDLVTGALPAQYGFRTAGVIEIDTRTDFQPQGHIDLYGGSNSTFKPSISYGNTDGKLSYFVNGAYQTSNVGIESPTPGANPLHDTTRQYRGFGYLSYLLSPVSKLSFMFGSYDGKFQIPNTPGLTPDAGGLGILPQLGLNGYDSATINDQQREVNRFAVASLQNSAGERFDYQLALFSRYSSVRYMPDITGNLVFNNGVAEGIFRSSFSNGIQTDGSYRLDPAHTLRMGIFGSSENIQSNNTYTVFPVNGAGTAVTGPATTIVDNNPKNGNTLFGMYLQDEWKATNKLTVNYGMRFDQVNAFVNEHQVSPRLGFVYKMSDRTTWHAGYARYFTPPPTELVSSATLALFNGTTNAQSGQNSPVKSERSNYLDAGVLQQLTPSLSFGVDTFYKKSKNLIDEGQFGPAPIMTPYNYADGKVYGIELTGNYKSGDLSAYANLARTVSLAKNIISSQYLFTQIDPATGLSVLQYSQNNWMNVDHQQALTLSFGGSYFWSGTHFNGNLEYQSGLRNGFANSTSLPSYALLNLGASREAKLGSMGKFEARVAITNVLDKVYQIRDTSGIGVGTSPAYGARRGIFIGLDKRF